MDNTRPDHIGQLSRMIYIDDSGAPQHGLVVYGWVEVQPAFWAPALRHWLEHRKALYRDFGVLVAAELHATDFVNGRGRVSLAPPDRYTDGDHVRWKDLGRDLARRSLEALGGCPYIRVGAVYTHEPAGGRAYAQARYQAYTDLVAKVDAQLRGADTYGYITMDGDDPHYRAAHRALKLDTRHLLEDPAAHDSRTSQWTQMADLVAYTAHLHLNRHDGNRFGWDWYTDHLGPLDPDGAPVPL